MIAVVDHIKIVDGKEILHSERILAKQNYKELLEDLHIQIELKRSKELTERNLYKVKDF